MVKAVVVLGGSEDVKGTIYFSQEGDGEIFRGLIVNSVLVFFKARFMVFFCHFRRYCFGNQILFREIEPLLQVQPQLLDPSLALSLDFTASMFMLLVTPPMVACQLVMTISFFQSDINDLT